MECPFCNIIKKEAEAYVIYESENIIAFLDIDPINEGHVLVVPKLHEDSIDNMPINIVTEIMETIQKVVTALREIYHMDGYSIMQNGGECCDFAHKIKRRRFGKTVCGSFYCPKHCCFRIWMTYLSHIKYLFFHREVSSCVRVVLFKTDANKKHI